MRLIPALAALALLAACGGGDQQQMPPPDVNVAAVVKKSVTEWDEYSGHIEAIESAEIRPRVAGHLNGVHYAEGSMVDKGQLLFTIDSREYRAAADAAAADASRAAARAALAEQELKRAESLIGERAISQGGARPAQDGGGAGQGGRCLPRARTTRVPASTSASPASARRSRAAPARRR